MIPLPQESSQERRQETSLYSVWSSVEIDIGFKNKCTSYFCPTISMILFNIIKMVYGHRSSSSSTGSSPLGIVIELRQSSPQPPTSLSPSHTHTLLATAATDSSSSLALVHHHRTIPHLSFVGVKAPHTTHQTNMSVEEGYDDYDHRLDGNDDDVRVDSAEDFVFQSLNNSEEAGDTDVFNQPTWRDE